MYTSESSSQGPLLTQTWGKNARLGFFFLCCLWHILLDRTKHLKILTVPLSSISLSSFSSSSGVWEYIETTRDQVRDLEQRVRLAKENVEAIRRSMEEWSHTSLYQRREDKNSTLLNLEVMKLEIMGGVWVWFWVVSVLAKLSHFDACT